MFFCCYRLVERGIYLISVAFGTRGSCRCREDPSTHGQSHRRRTTFGGQPGRHRLQDVGNLRRVALRNLGKRGRAADESALTPDRRWRFHRWCRRHRTRRGRTRRSRRRRGQPPRRRGRRECCRTAADPQGRTCRSCRARCGRWGSRRAIPRRSRGSSCPAWRHGASREARPALSGKNISPNWQTTRIELVVGKRKRAGVGDPPFEPRIRGDVGARDLEHRLAEIGGHEMTALRKARQQMTSDDARPGGDLEQPAAALENHTGGRVTRVGLEEHRAQAVVVILRRRTRRMSTGVLTGGRVSVARAPRPSVRFSSFSDPSCASAICRHSTRPMPDPPGLVVKNGTNRLVVFDKPGPSSSTQMSTPWRVRRQPTVTDAAADFETRVGGVANQVDEQLLDLIGVDGDGDDRARAERAPARASRARRS